MENNTSLDSIPSPCSGIFLLWRLPWEPGVQGPGVRQQGQEQEHLQRHQLLLRLLLWGRGEGPVQADKRHQGGNYFLCLDLNYFLRSREELLEELKEKAVNVGANAIIGLRWTREYLSEICSNLKYSVEWRPTPCSRECSTWWWWGLPCISWDDSVHT